MAFCKPTEYMVLGEIFIGIYFPNEYKNGGGGVKNPYLKLRTES